MASVDYLTDFIFGLQGNDLSFETPENEQAATVLHDWAEQGYFTPGFGGGGYDDAVANFAKGEGLFMIAGNWIVESLGADSQDFGFFVMPPMEAGGSPVSTGGAGFPLSISGGAEHPDDAAAAYIDWMTSDRAADLLHDGSDPVERRGTDPAPGGDRAGGRGERRGDREREQRHGPVPGLGHPDVLRHDDGGDQELMAARSPQEFVAKIQDDYSTFQSSRT